MKGLKFCTAHGSYELKMMPKVQVSRKVRLTGKKCTSSDMQNELLKSMAVGSLW